MKLIKRNIEGTPMYLDASMIGISSTLKTAGKREPCFMKILREEAVGDVGIDVGANIGYTTLSIIKKMKRVVAIEPDHRARYVLEKNIELNKLQDRIDIHNFCISDANITKNFTLDRHPNLSHIDDKSKTGQKIECRTIDSLGLEIDFMKMDIEGHEVQAISGAMETLKNSSNPKILIEVHPEKYGKNLDFSSVLKELVEMGFVFKYVISAAVAIPDLIRKYGYKPYKVMQAQRYTRAIYKNMKSEDAIFFSSKVHKQKVKYSQGGEIKQKISSKIVRAIFLEKK